jgi:hypothetical protein
VTNAAFGWTAKPFVIAGVSSVVKSGTGIMEHTLSLGGDPVRLTKAIAAASAGQRLTSITGSRISGQVGG